MVRLFVSLAAMALAASALAQGTQFAIETPALTVDGGNVNLSFRIAGMPQSVRDVKILFCECGTTRGGVANPNGGFHEEAILQPWQDWYRSRADGQTTVKQMLLAGWFIHSIIPRGGSIAIDQFYVVFVK